jgi:hypothetical protein
VRPHYFTRSLAHEWNYDYRELNDVNSGKTYYRGAYVYRRPCGWYRFALAVLGKYDNNEWLGPKGDRTQTTNSEWPAAYSGTLLRTSNDVTAQHFDAADKRTPFAHLDGVFTACDVQYAAAYSTTFTHANKTYEIVLQSRVRPNAIRVAYGKLTDANGRTLHEGDEFFVQASADLRPYGICIREAQARK